MIDWFISNNFSLKHVENAGVIMYMKFKANDKMIERENTINFMGVSLNDNITWKIIKISLKNVWRINNRNNKEWIKVAFQAAAIW